MPTLIRVDTYCQYQILQFLVIWSRLNTRNIPEMVVPLAAADNIRPKIIMLVVRTMAVRRKLSQVRLSGYWQRNSYHFVTAYHGLDEYEHTLPRLVL